MARLPLIVLVSVLVISLLPLACGKEKQPPPRPTLQVRALTTDPVAEQLVHDLRTGLERMSGELNAETALLRGADENQRRLLLRQVSEAGADLVFCFGGAFEAAIYTEARTYPDTCFVLLPGASSAANVASILFQVEDAAFLAGVLASLLRQDLQVGIIKGEGGPWLTRIEDGFTKGLQKHRPRLEPLSAEGPAAPWELAAQGVSIALYAADRADPAVLAAAHDAGVGLVVTDPQALTSDPDVALAAVTSDLPEAMVRIAHEVADGTFAGRVYTFDLGSGVVDLRLGPRLMQPELARLRAALDATRAEITAGWVEIEQLGL